MWSRLSSNRSSGIPPRSTVTAAAFFRSHRSSTVGSCAPSAAWTADIRRSITRGSLIGTTAQQRTVGGDLDRWRRHVTEPGALGVDMQRDRAEEQVDGCPLTVDRYLDRSGASSRTYLDDGEHPLAYIRAAWDVGEQPG